jgi:hypothetical protein
MNGSLIRNLLLGSALLASVSGGGILRAGTVSYFAFTGTCRDCTGTGVGTLELQNYTQGTAISSSNFVDFSYTSNLLTFDINSSSAGLFVSGTIPTVLPSGNVLFTIEDNATILQSSTGNLGWCAGNSCSDDYGPSYTWSATTAPSGTPEPATALLVAPFVAGLWFYRRRSPRVR